MSNVRIATRGHKKHTVGRLTGARSLSLAISVLILIQYGIGMDVNLNVNVPKADEHHGLATAFDRALSKPPTTLANHVGFGLIVLVAAIFVLWRAIVARQRAVTVLSAVGLLAIAGAAVSGAAFVDKAQTGYSLMMALLTGVALLCYIINIFLVRSHLD